MARSLAPLFSLLLATSILLIGNGLQGTLIPVRGDIDQFSEMALGLIGAAYFAGFVFGCWHCPRVVQSVGHIRSFAVFASIASATPLIHPILPDETVWFILRALSGYCFAGLYMVIESWINETSTNETRGRLLGIYLVVNLLSVTAGQLLLNLSAPEGFILFAVASVLTSVALVPVALTSTVQPAPIESTKIDFKGLWAVTPVSTLGCFIVGMTSGPFWTLAPVYARQAGLDIAGISYFMTAAIIGGAAAQLPLGRLSDRMDRRIVIAGIAVGGAIGAVLLAFFQIASNLFFLLGLSTFFGFFALTLYSICMAHANDHAKPSQFVTVSSGLLLLYALGAVVGPLMISFALPYTGTWFVFGFAAIFYVLFTAFVVLRIMVKAPVPEEQREDFVAVPISRTGPAPVELDPRGEEGEERESELGEGDLDEAAELGRQA
ncbi:major facilitator transporter [Tepidicaulis marinus]|uniref:Major facilitator transporter n=1 Tax=Tepidicaulis marinus TaxID=1333998 RepID=A0A081B955_9HYPH|nr:MFS transporter [Tepidicaulis marinus]GAK44573.1 major facilitator transporter [Tepidicaulis marinus]